MSALDSIGFGGATSRPKIRLETSHQRGPDATPPGSGAIGGGDRDATSEHVPIFSDSLPSPCPDVGRLEKRPADVSQRRSPLGRGTAPQGELALP